MSNPSDSSKQSIQVKYNELKAVYAAQALVQASKEEVFLDFSSGVVADAGGTNVMPIHTRIAMTHAGAQRLLNALSQTLQQQNQNDQAN